MIAFANIYHILSPQSNLTIKVEGILLRLPIQMRYNIMSRSIGARQCPRGIKSTDLQSVSASLQFWL